MTVHFQVAEMASGSYWHLAFLRWSLVAIFIWFATLLEQFLLKDIALLAAPFTLLLASLSP
jgi:hypothetical protein